MRWGLRVQARWSQRVAGVAFREPPSASSSALPSSCRRKRCSAEGAPRSPDSFASTSSPLASASVGETRASGGRACASLCGAEHKSAEAIQRVFRGLQGRLHLLVLLRLLAEQLEQRRGRGHAQPRVRSRGRRVLDERELVLLGVVRHGLRQLLWTAVSPRLSTQTTTANQEHHQRQPWTEMR